MFVLSEAAPDKSGYDNGLSGSKIKIVFGLRKKVLLMEDMRVYIRVPRRFRAKDGNWISLANFNRMIDLYNVTKTKLGFWEYLSEMCQVTILDFDMTRNIGNQAFKYIHIIKSKG